MPATDQLCGGVAMSGPFPMAFPADPPTRPFPPVRPDNPIPHPSPSGPAGSAPPVFPPPICKRCTPVIEVHPSHCEWCTSITVVCCLFKYYIFFFFLYTTVHNGTHIEVHHLQLVAPFGWVTKSVGPAGLVWFLGGVGGIGVYECLGVVD